MPGTDDRLQRALALAYRYLNRRDRTEAEVRRHLEGKGLQTDAIEHSIEALREHGSLDDARFARLFADDKRELEQWGSERIRLTLVARGVNGDLIDAALAGPAPADEQDSARRGIGAGELDRALSLLRRRFPSPPSDRRDRDRALGVLLRKGYDPDLAFEALDAHARAPQDADVR